MKAATIGKKHTGNVGICTPETLEKIRTFWTPERREQKRQEMLLRNPESREAFLGYATLGSQSPDRTS